jgi:uncharacterized repeat protein (TIGR03803 family)
VLHSFGTNGDGEQPNGSLIQASDGNLYGMTLGGGANNSGAVIKMTPAGAESVLHSFGSAGDGTFPSGRLFQASDGNFYGLTPAGGANGNGAVIKVTPAGIESVLHSFGSAGDGSSPKDSLIQAIDGSLYGMTPIGGANNEGTVIKVTLAGTESVLYSFVGSAADGSSPKGSLIQASDGNFYGMTLMGGANGNGTMIVVMPTGTESVLHSFGFPGDGSSPQDSLIQASDGNFYGMTQNGGANGGGAVIKVTSAGTESVLYSFVYGLPYGSLIQASDGNFYGMTYEGGSNGAGAVIKVTPSGAESVLHSFGSAGDGQSPMGSLIQASDGNFYGVTYEGGANSNGAVIKVTPAGTESVLCSLGSAGNGTYPNGNLIQASDGNFYGMTPSGGAKNVGTVFRVTPAGTESVLHSFGSTGDGQSPMGSLIQASDGNLYGMTDQGGANNLGTVFMITPAGIESVLYSFGSQGDGYYPYGSLIQASDGNLYGMTQSGGANSEGAVIKITW